MKKVLFALGLVVLLVTACSVGEDKGLIKPAATSTLAPTSVSAVLTPVVVCKPKYLGKDYPDMQPDTWSKDYVADIVSVRFYCNADGTYNAIPIVPTATVIPPTSTLAPSATQIATATVPYATPTKFGDEIHWDAPTVAPTAAPATATATATTVFNPPPPATIQYAVTATAMPPMPTTDTGGLPTIPPSDSNQGQGNATQVPTQGTAAADCKFPAPGDMDKMPKNVIELVAENTWFHRVFNPRLFNEANKWAGADSWFATLAKGHNSGGAWTSFGVTGQIVYRGTQNHLVWCLGVLTTAKHKSEFLVGAKDVPVAINVRIAPESSVTVVTASGQTVTQATSDAGDITIILPDSGIVTISVDYTTAAPTHESLVWWGPYDRSKDINTIDARGGTTPVGTPVANKK